MDPSLSSATHSPTLSSPSSPSSSPKSWFSGMVRSRSNKSGGSRMGADSVTVVTGDCRSAVVRKHQFQGVLFKYGPNAIQVAFRTGEHKRQVIFIGGLANGFLATAYLEPLAMALDIENWSLVQFLRSSSYGGYGTSSLQQDAKELDLLINYLIDKEDSEGVILLGHSTGCQDIIHYMSTNAACTRAVRAAIFQAPVSDREFQATLPHTASMAELAAKMISEGRSSEFMPRDADPNGPITAYRYNSLCSYNGDDDLFSSDLSDEQLKTRLGHMSCTQCQVIFSMSDEHVPDYIDKKLLTDRLCRAMGGAEKVEIENGTHSLSNRVEEVANVIIDFIKREGPKGWDDPWT
ncbi:UPF0613 protein PB24D3.06c-like [Neltuma alba]|uniref:UPF0613 protein PB24D3.06c-like n=1 Tax=Neltuma alba TaxID=207710 RepID=UPI0010A43C41|nr:UPF0613 protein PB24D3.06c-like [Prosopis alba]